MPERFELKKTPGGMWFIKDNAHDATVCHLCTFKNQERVLKMAATMVDALNAAVNRPVRQTL